MKQKFLVTGMMCAACQASIDKSVRSLSGVGNVNVNLISNNMVVDFNESAVSVSDIISAVENAGYGAEIYDAKTIAEKKAAVAKKEKRDAVIRLWVSFIFLIPLMYLTMHHMLYEFLRIPVPQFMTDLFHGNNNALRMAITQLILVAPILIVNRKYFIVGFKTLFRGKPNMDSLIAIGSSASFLYGVFAIIRIWMAMSVSDMTVVETYSSSLYFESAGMILALITLGKYLESRAKGRTDQALKKLMKLAPKTASVIRDGEETELPVDEIKRGDIIVIRSGQSIPVDGKIIEGNGVLNQAAITGESIPKEVAEGDKVISATINENGFFKFIAENVGEDTTISQIIRLVEDAGNSKAPISKLADKISGIFVPIVIIIAIISAVIWIAFGATFEFALSIAISVLVISCPCALGLATPVAIMVGTGKGAENGILIKSAEALEVLHSIKTVVLDKTGTITEGRPSVTDIIPVSGVEPSFLLKVAASIEHASEHPIAKAIVAKGEERRIGFIPTEEFENLSGKGISATIGGKRYIAGNSAFMHSSGIDLLNLKKEGEIIAGQGKTPVFVAEDGEAIGLIAVADKIKPTSAEAIRDFKHLGIEVIMLTGDNKITAEAIRRELNLDSYVADVLPADKEEKIRRLQSEGKKVAMIGDGINDAPALVRADVGIAIGAGTDVAVDAADIVLVRSDLSDAVSAVKLSKSVIRNIKENLFWAFFYNTIGIPVASGVFFNIAGLLLNPMIGAAAMSISSVCVVLNALRLKFFKVRDNKTVI